MELQLSLQATQPTTVVSGPQMRGVTAIAADSRGDLYVTTRLLHSVQRITINRYSNNTIKAVLVSVFAIGIEFSSAMGLAVDSNDMVFVAGQRSDRIMQITQQGTVSVHFQGPPLRKPAGIAVDANDNLLVTNLDGKTLADVTTFTPYLFLRHCKSQEKVRVSFRFLRVARPMCYQPRAHQTTFVAPNAVPAA